MNQKSNTQKAKVVRCLVEGMSVRSTCRITGFSKNTVIRILCELGDAASRFLDENLVNLNSLVVQSDEIWSFVGKKMKRTTAEDRAQGLGDVWTWVAMDADSKLVITWRVGLRSEVDCREFIADLAFRLKNRIQLSTDGFGAYNSAVKLEFGANVDYGQVIKMFGTEEEGSHRYSPPVVTSCYSKAITGDPIDSLISTSYIERQNLTMRMKMRRFTRLTNGFSKKLENHAAAIALHYMHYNYCCPHKTLTDATGEPGYRTPTTPAMAAGLEEYVWTVEEMVCRLLAL